jgi:hypothetical protein
MFQIGPLYRAYLRTVSAAYPIVVSIGSQVETPFSILIFDASS